MILTAQQINTIPYGLIVIPFSQVVLRNNWTILLPSIVSIARINRSHKRNYDITWLHSFAIQLQRFTDSCLSPEKLISLRLFSCPQRKPKIRRAIFSLYFSHLLRATKHGYHIIKEKSQGFFRVDLKFYWTIF